jgi:hypothetical protein
MFKNNIENGEFERNPLEKKGGCVVFAILTIGSSL